MAIISVVAGLSTLLVLLWFLCGTPKISTMTDHRVHVALRASHPAIQHTREQHDVSDIFADSKSAPAQRRLNQAAALMPCAVRDVRMQGNQILLGTAKDVSECQAMCVATTFCAFFSFGPKSNGDLVCRSFPATSSTGVKIGWTSGPRMCQELPSAVVTMDGCLTDGDEKIRIKEIPPTLHLSVNCCGENTCIRNEPKTKDRCELLTYAEAHAKCSLLGLRLCSVSELTHGKCCDKGCGADNRRSWTSDVVGPKTMILALPLGEGCSDQNEVGDVLSAASGTTAENCKSLCEKEDACEHAVFEMKNDSFSGRCRAWRTCSATAKIPGSITWKKVIDTAECKVPEPDLFRTVFLPKCRPDNIMQCSSQKAAQTTFCMTARQYDEVAATVANIVSNLPDACNSTFCPQADWAGCVLRVAGHDFMDFKSGVGGSDACTDMNDPDNKGLATCLVNGEFGVSISDAYNFHCGDISLADFLVIAAESVMTEARTRHLKDSGAQLDIIFKDSFRFGRRTAGEKCLFEEGLLPNPEDSCNAVQRVFVENMALDPSDEDNGKRLAAALMGVHSLGRARAVHSGYNGWWSDAENSRKFNNDYYISIVSKGWMPERSVNGNPGKNQWMRGDRCRPGGDGKFCGSGGSEGAAPKENDAHQMMLNTDICLAFPDKGGRNGPQSLNLKDNNGVLNSANDNCCAWVHSQDFKHVGMGQICASQSGTFCGARRAGCGDGNGELNGLEFGDCCRISPSSQADCGSPSGLGITGQKGAPVGGSTGFATQAVFDFASNEQTWLVEFQKAWTTATENGFAGSLRKLDSC